MGTSYLVCTNTLTKRLQTAAVVIGCIAMVLACSKNGMQGIQQAQQETIEKFLTLPPSTAPEVQRVAAILKSRNERTGFLNTMIKQHGFAIWDKAIIGSGAKKGGAFAKSSNSSDTIAYIPLVLENANHVNAFIYATLNGSVQLRFYRATDYERYGFGNLQHPSKNADKLAMQFMLLDLKVFGHTDFKVLDNRLLKNDSIPSGTPIRNKIVHIEPAQNTGGRYEVWTVNVCTTTPYLQCTTNHSCCPDGSCPACQAACWHTKTVCTSFTSIVFVDDGNWGGGGGSGGGTGGGGSGGGGGTTPTGQEPCNPTPLLDNGLLPCPEGNTAGWEPIITKQWGGEQSFSIESINKSGITNPCILGILNDMGINGHKSPLLKLYQQYFGPIGMDKLNIKYVQNDSLVGQNNQPIAGHTDSIVILPNGNKEITISLNPTFMHKASKEFIASTILHELVHAFLMIKYPSLSQSDQHQKMLDIYAGAIALSLGELFPSLPATDAISLSLQGLEDIYLTLNAQGGYDVIQSQTIKSIQNWGQGLGAAREIGLKFFDGTMGSHC